MTRFNKKNFFSENRMEIIYLIENADMNGGFVFRGNRNIYNKLLLKVV